MFSFCVHAGDVSQANADACALVLHAHENGYVLQIYPSQYGCGYDDYHHADENAYVRVFYAYGDVNGCLA